MTRAKAAPPSAPQKGRGWERRYMRFDCDLEGYEDQGFWMECWTNMPEKVRRLLFTGTNEEIDALFQEHRFVRAWYVTDHEGNELPLPHEEAGNAEGLLPFDLSVWVLDTVRNAPVLAWGKSQAKSDGK